MIITLLIYILSFILGAISGLMTLLANGWSIWPSSVLSGMTYFFTQLMNFNFLFPVDTFLAVLIFMVRFDVIYVGVRLLLKMFNWIRGSGGLDI